MPLAEGTLRRHPALFVLALLWSTLLAYGQSRAAPVPAETMPDAVLQETYAANARTIPRLEDRAAWLKSFGDPAAIDLLNQQWSITRQWVIRYATAHQGETALDLEPALRQLHPALADSVLPTLKLDRDTYLIGPPADFSKVFAIQRRGGRFRLAWQIPDELDAKIWRRAETPGTVGYLAPWTAESDLTDGKPNSSWTFGRLPDAMNGDHRFYLQTVRGQWAGQLGTAQVTIWRWHKDKAALALAIDHSFNDCIPVVNFDGRILHIPTRTEYRVLWENAGGCGRLRDQQVLVDSDKIGFSGTLDLEPEESLVDRLLSRIVAHRDASAFAAPQAIAALEADIVRHPSGWAKPKSLNALVASAIERHGARTRLCMALESLRSPPDTNPSRFRFTIDAKAGRPFVETAAIGDGWDCRPPNPNPQPTKLSRR